VSKIRVKMAAAKDAHARTIAGYQTTALGKPCVDEHVAGPIGNVIT
jgi:hypothetical protein